MTQSITATAPARSAVAAGPGSHRLLLLAAIALAAAIGFAAADPADTARVAAQTDPALAALLRFMATVKAAMAVATIGVIFWRLRLPATFARVMLYTAFAAPMAAGPALIWGLAHVGLGAALLHGGLAGCLVLLWRDPVVGSAVAERVATLRPDPVHPASPAAAALPADNSEPVHRLER